jgi:hypothetical protein
MALATIYPEPEKAGRRKNGSVTEPLPVTKERLSLARLVLRLGPDELAKGTSRRGASGLYRVTTSMVVAARNGETGRFVRLTPPAQCRVVS